MKLVTCLIAGVLTIYFLLSPANATGGESKVSGDVRYRYDIDTSSKEKLNRDRQRIRARLGLTYSSDKVTAGIRMATSSNSVQSPHHTLGTADASDNASFGLDRAFLSIDFASYSNITLGKSKARWWQQNEIFIDNDLSPEGIAFTYAKGNVTVNLANYIASELNYNGVGKDDNFGWGQVIFKRSIGSLRSVLATGFATIYKNSEDTTFVDRNIFSATAQLNVDNFTVGIDFLNSDSDSANNSFVAMFKYIVGDYKFGVWYYDVGHNSTLSPGFSQDNFPVSVGFSGIRLQVNRTILENINADLRYYVQSIDSNNADLTRLQLNLNVKF